MTLLTIVSVLGPDDKKYIQKNIELIKELNFYKFDIKIELIDNFPEKGEIILDNYKDIKINIFEGVSQNQIYPDLRMKTATILCVDTGLLKINTRQTSIRAGTTAIPRLRCGARKGQVIRRIQYVALRINQLL